MRILFLTQYYSPETGAPPARLSDWARRLGTYGHITTVLTALPNYPHGEVFQGYRGRFMMEEQIDNVRVIRSWIYATNSKGFVRRLLNYFSFVLSSLLVGIGTVSRHDIVVVESPPLFLGLSGLLISRLRGAKLVFNVSDLWPQSAVEMGMVRSRVLISLSTRLEEFIYRHSHAVTGQTVGIVQNIQSRFSQKRVALMTNGVDPEVFVEASRLTKAAAAIRQEFGLGRQFVVGYAGLHGLAQGLETVIEAARLVSAHHDIVFVFFGDGPSKKELQQLVDRHQVKNVRFYPTQPKARMPEIIASFDISLIPLRRLNVFKGALPSKMFEAMAAAVPLILSIDGEAHALVDVAGAGVYAEPENPQALAAAVLQLYDDPAMRQRLGQNGRQYVMKHFDRREIAKTFEQFLLTVCGSEVSNNQPKPVTGASPAIMKVKKHEVTK